MKKTIIFFLTIFLINVSIVVAKTTVEEEIALGDTAINKVRTARWSHEQQNALANTASAHYEKAKVLLLKKLVEKFCNE